ncbi:MAG TPA: hypothetical protein VMW17_25005 [Candidatus Binatia bacterium]|nr:hypothetical protein [Candidatus Binatia bacterium]
MTLAFWATPSAVFALPTGAVTTVSLGTAPALTMPLLYLLAGLLAVVAVYRLRLSPAGQIVGAVLLTGVAVTAFVYAGGATVSVTGANCMKQTTTPFDPTVSTTLISGCANPIRIVDIQLSCDDPPPPSQPCTIGLTLNQGDSCYLPTCSG